MDEYILYDLHDLRGRAPRELARMLCDHLPEDRPCVYASDQQHAMLWGWQRVRPGDRLIIVVDEVDEGIALIDALAKSIMEDASCEALIASER